MHWSYFCTKSYCSWPHCFSNSGHSPSCACGVFLCVHDLRIDDTGLCVGVCNNLCGYMVGFTEISKLVLALLLLLLLFLGVSRPGVLETAGRRFCCCRFRIDDRGGNPRFDINRLTPLSERCSPSFAKAAL